MKKIAFVACIVALFASSCANTESKSAPAAVSTDSATTSCNIRYIDVDSILSAYTLAQELFAEQQKEVNALESAARQKESELQRMQASIESKARNNGYLSEQSFNTDVASLQQRQNEAGQWLNTHQERIARLMATQRQQLDDSLQNFLKAYNAVYNYDAILDKKCGFFNPSLDITDQIISGLNERYAASKSAK